MGVQFRIDMAFRLVKRHEEGKPVNPRELALARSVMAWARANGVKPGARRTGKGGVTPPHRFSWGLWRKG